MFSALTMVLVSDAMSKVRAIKQSCDCGAIRRSHAQGLAVGEQSVRVLHDLIGYAARNTIKMRTRCDCAAVSAHRCLDCWHSRASRGIAHLVRERNH